MVQVLHRLPPASHPDLLVGTEQFADAGVFRIDDRTALVQTLDFFPPLVDDPFVFGQIAAANSLSDVYAMGATPLTAMNIVGFPDQELSIDILVEILRGGAERVARAGAVLLGGHSVRDAEIKYGLSVTGRIDPDRIVTNAGAQAGDLLVLTKPIGSGVLTGAAKSNRIDPEELAEAIEVMRQLNDGGAAAMTEVGVHAATDITGFGLIGHAAEVAEASGVTLEIEAAKVPLMNRALELAAEGLLTRMHKSTLLQLAGGLDAAGVDPVLLNLLCDAQTSGGLLICVPPERCDALVGALEQHDACCWSVIGRVLDRGEAVIRLV